jgi:glutathione-regulated potassium-efflux system ancillary protein KefG
MNKILIIFAHPALEKSRAHKVLLKHVDKLEGVTVNDLYENYPDFDIDVHHEQDQLLAHDIFIWQHPLYWYSCPAMLKQWMDLVLEHGWAYGKRDSLSGERGSSTPSLRVEEEMLMHLVAFMVAPFRKS